MLYCQTLHVDENKPTTKIEPGKIRHVWKSTKIYGIRHKKYFPEHFLYTPRTQQKRQTWIALNFKNRTLTNKYLFHYTSSHKNHTASRNQNQVIRSYLFWVKSLQSCNPALETCLSLFADTSTCWANSWEPFCQRKRGRPSCDPSHTDKQISPCVHRPADWYQRKPWRWARRRMTFRCRMPWIYSDGALRWPRCRYVILLASACPSSTVQPSRRGIRRSISGCRPLVYGGLFMYKWRNAHLVCD